ncbi:MAG: KdsC family phosphatase [Crocinitomicaceae bacterium]
MTVYYNNLTYLLDQRNISVSQFENIILIPKVRIVEPTPNELIKIADYFEISIDQLLKEQLRDLNKILSADIQFLILDVDGTMTDGGMYFTENGDMMKKYNTKDGMAIKGLTKAGFHVGIISHSHQSKMVENRANMLGIQNVYVGAESKLVILDQWLLDLKLTRKQVAFIGDDINDLEIMKSVGISACPHDAVDSVRAISDIVLVNNGGQTCVREFIDKYLNTK